MSVTAPQIDKNPAPCPVCDVTVTLGLLTSACESAGPLKGKCFEILRPLEEGKKVKPADVVRDVLIALGEEKFNETVERFNLIMFDATSQAKEILVKEGKLNKDGTPRIDPAEKLAEMVI